MVAPLLSIFARWPTPGMAKTRLIPGFGPEGAAAVYGKLLEHTVRAARASGLPFELRVTGAGPADFQGWLGADMAVVDQGEGDLTAKLQRVSAPGMAIGSDCPGLTGDLLRGAAAALEKTPFALGPASDGGYWLIGFAQNSPWLFDSMEWSTDAVAPETTRRIKARGHALTLLPELSDVDEPQDLDAWPEFRP